MRHAVPFVLLCACAAHVRGVVTQVDTGPRLMEPEGRLRELRPVAPIAAEIRYLNGEEVLVHGTGLGRKINVERWELLAGTHGLQAFVGDLGASARGFGVNDRTSQAFYTIDEAAVDDLIAWTGRPVIIEGYVEGAQAIRVVYYRPLFAVESPP